MDDQIEIEDNHELNDVLEQNKSLLDKLLNQKIKPDSSPLLAKISTFDKDGYALVTFSLNQKNYNLKAKSIVKLKLEQIGQKCLLNFNQGKINEPIIIGLLQAPLSIEEQFNADAPVVIHSESGIVLQCGSSRIELTNEGTINIQGMHINSQAYGPHRIKGGSVKIN